MFELELDWVESNLFRKLLKLICTFARELLPRKTWADLDNLERSGEYEGKKTRPSEPLSYPTCWELTPPRSIARFSVRPGWQHSRAFWGCRVAKWHTLWRYLDVSGVASQVPRERESLNRSNCFLAWAGARWPQQNWVPVAKSIRNSADRVKQFIYI